MFELVQVHGGNDYAEVAIRAKEGSGSKKVYAGILRLVDNPKSFYLPSEYDCADHPTNTPVEIKINGVTCYLSRKEN